MRYPGNRARHAAGAHVALSFISHQHRLAWGEEWESGRETTVQGEDDLETDEPPFRLGSTPGPQDHDDSRAIKTATSRHLRALVRRRSRPGSLDKHLAGITPNARGAPFERIPG